MAEQDVLDLPDQQDVNDDNDMPEEEGVEESNENHSQVDHTEYENLKSQLEKLKAKNDELHQARIKAKRAAEQAAIEAAKKSGDIEAIEKSWGEKLATREEELNSDIQMYRQMIGEMTAGAEAMKMANELSIPGSSEVLLPHINARLKTEIVEGVAKVRVLGKDGKPSAMTIDDLRKEVASNPAFAPILLGSRASGGGSVNTSSIATAKKFDQMSSAELSTLRRESPADYERIKNEFYSQQQQQRPQRRM